MKRCGLKAVALCLTLLAGISSALAADAVSTRTLLAELTDLERLALLPQPSFTCRQFSSYDRASTSSADAEHWFANADAGQYLRIEEHNGRKEHVLAEMDGPGAIVRIWSANPAGTLRIYLDDAPVAALEAPLADFLSGKLPGFPEPIATVSSRGWNSYFPIPYAKRCKITSDAGGFYYHVNYRTYAAGTPVETFRREDLKACAAEIDRLAAALRTPATAAPRRADVETQPGDFGMGPGESFAIRLRGARALTSLRVAPKADNLIDALRQTVISLSFDGQETVAAPLGDFFGSAPGVNAYESLVAGVAKDGRMRCNWVMPFREAVEIRMTNHGSQRVDVSVEVDHVPWVWDARSMYFHAKWRAEYDVPTRPMIDWNYLTAGGAPGTFVGAAFSIANPVKQWWGEGDEKIYVDNESFPSFFGTGTEDYYGYAWCWPEPFSHAYHNQTRCDGPGNYGQTSVNRWHIIDCIPYTRDFRFDMELWHWHPDTKVAMAITSYWYSRPEGTDRFAPIDPAALRVVRLPTYTPARVAGALEGEEMTELQRSGGELEVQPWDGLSNENHRWWRHAAVGDRLVLGFASPQAGRFMVYARFLRAGDYGVHQISINGKPAGEPLDFYHDGVKPTEEMPLGEFDLKAGENQIMVEVKGANARATPGNMFGLDYLRLATP